MKIFTLPSEIYEETAENFLWLLENANAGDMVDIPACYGGDVDIALKIAMKIKEKGLNTSAGFFVASAGIPIFSAGKERFANSWTRFFLHQTQIPVYIETNVNKSTLGADYDTLETYDQVMAKFIAHNIGANENEILNLINNEGGNGTWFDLEKAIELNLVTQLKEETAEAVALVAKLNLFKEEDKQMAEEKKPETQEPQSGVSDVELQVNALNASLAEVQKLFAERLDNLEKKLETITDSVKEVAKEAKLKPLSPEEIDKTNEKPKTNLQRYIEKALNK